jgi:hypothetical protein
MKPVYVAGMLYQYLPANADITFEAGMLDMVLGEEQSLSGIDGAPGFDFLAWNGSDLARGATVSEMNGVAWERISSKNP